MPPPPQSRLAAILPTAAVAIYEMIGPDDPFGAQMVSNLEARRIEGPPVSGLAGRDGSGKILGGCEFDESGFRGAKKNAGRETETEFMILWRVGASLFFGSLLCMLTPPRLSRFPPPPAPGL